MKDKITSGKISRVILSTYFPESGCDLVDVQGEGKHDSGLGMSTVRHCFHGNRCLVTEITRPQWLIPLAVQSQQSVDAGRMNYKDLS